MSEFQRTFPLSHSNAPAATPPLLPGEKEWGFRLLSENRREGLEATDDRDVFAGVIVQSVEPNCRLAGLAPRDIILSVEDVDTPNLAAYCRAASRLCAEPAPQPVRFTVISQGRHRDLPISGE